MDVEYPGAFRNTPLMNAVTNNKQTMAQVLLEAGVDAKKDFITTDPPINVPSHFASEIMIKVLQDYGASMSKTGRGAWTVLHKAALSVNIAVILVLYHGGVSTDAFDVNENSALHLAVIHWNLNFTQQFMHIGMSASAGEPGGRMPIHAPARHGYSAILQLSIDARADPR